MELRIFVFCIDSTTETKLFVVAKVTEFYTRLEETLEFARDVFYLKFGYQVSFDTSIDSG